MSTDGRIPTRRWYRFSLRTLLVFVSLLSVALSWFAHRMRQAETQRKAVEALCNDESVACQGVIYDALCESLEPLRTIYNIPNFDRKPPWASKFLGIDFFWSVIMVEVENDRALLLARGLPHLQVLVVRTDAQSRRRVFVDDDGTATEEDDDPFVKMAKQAPMNEITGAALKHLAEFTQVKELSLHGKVVTDEALRYLTSLRQLKRLGLHGTSVTEAGIRTVRAALPHTTIVTSRWAGRIMRRYPTYQTEPDVPAPVLYSREPPSENGSR